MMSISYGKKTFCADLAVKRGKRQMTIVTRSRHQNVSWPKHSAAAL